MKYAFEAIDAKGRVQKGVIDAEQEREVQRTLRRQGLTLTSISGVDSRGSLGGWKKQPRAQDIVLLLEELSLLLSAGITLADAVVTVGREHPHPSIRRALGELERSLRSGGRLSVGLREAFPQLPVYVPPIVEAGEAVGGIGNALRDAAGQMSYEDQVRRDLRNALTYPVILIITGISAVLFIFVVVVPRFAGMIARGGSDVPWISSAVINTGMFFNENVTAILAIVAAAAAGLMFALRRPEWRAQAYGYILKTPILGSWLREAEIARWAATLATMLENRVVLLDGLAMARQGLKDVVFQTQLEQAEIAVRGGESLSEALGQGSGLNATALNLVRVGEEAGELAKMLRSLWRLYERSSKGKMKRFLALLEPIAILLIGGVIGVIITAILLAITSIQQVAI